MTRDKVTDVACAVPKRTPVREREKREKKSEKERKRRQREKISKFFRVFFFVRVFCSFSSLSLVLSL